MIIPTWNHKMQHALRLVMLAAWSCVIGLQIGSTEVDSIEKDKFQISVDAQPIKFTTPPVLKDDLWLVPLDHFAKRLGLKVEYPEGEEMVVLCGAAESEICVPLRLQDSKNGAIDIDGITYAQPVSVAEPFGFEIYEISPNKLEVMQPMHLASEFTLPDLQETPRSLRDFRGKKTLLYVWGSW